MYICKGVFVSPPIRVGSYIQGYICMYMCTYGHISGYMCFHQYVWVRIYRGAYVCKCVHMGIWMGIWYIYDVWALYAI